LVIVLLACLAVIETNALADDVLITSIVELTTPVANVASEPSLSTMTDRRVLMSWTEPQGKGFAVKATISDKAGWSKPQTVVEPNYLFVNWAGFPSAIV
jgi:hypothetical protein